MASGVRTLAQPTDPYPEQSMTRSLALGLAIAAAVVAAVPIVAYVFPRHPNWLDPYESRVARWTVYIGGGVALALFIAVARSG